MGWTAKPSATTQIERRDEPYLTAKMKKHYTAELVPRYEQRQGALLPILHDVQERYRCIPYQAIVVGVTESDPLDQEGTITVITPAFTGTDTGIQQTADVRVIANAGTGAQENDTLPDAFVLLPGGGPVIFGVSPNSGRSSGGEVVNVLGQGFGSVASDLSVSFTDVEGIVKVGTVMAVSPDGTQIQVETPRFSTLTLTDDQPQDVTVATMLGSLPASIPNTGIPAVAAASRPAPICAGSTLTTMASTFWVTLSSMRAMTAATSPAVSITLRSQPMPAASASKAST